ncbi:transmembrane protein 114 [Eublepharis macularius]|uniref:Transmembrane protein 114 n=1 Tax=Eublepharis macularius TaxID=481883 RepID=A0AA97K7Y3_EUBMA|nr:transmembrane protein 114 [Eublepharis macularius]
MKVTLNTVSLLAALLGILSFIFLVVAIGTDFWYLIDTSKLEMLGNHTGSLGSHSGLWRTCHAENTCFPIVNPFRYETANITSSHRQLLHMQGTFVILLPLSLVWMVFGGMTGFISLLAKAYFCLLLTGLLFLFGALITLAGVSIYIAFAIAAFKETIFLLGRRKGLEGVNIQFSWSLAFVWLSFASEVLTGLVFLLAARMVGLKRRNNCSI